MTYGANSYCAIDIPYQQFEFIKKLKMTKKEIKDELKDIEGQPEVRQNTPKKETSTTTNA